MAVIVADSYTIGDFFNDIKTIGKFFAILIHVMIL
jgi:hypothetical protein